MTMNKKKVLGRYKLANLRTIAISMELTIIRARTYKKFILINVDG